MFVVHSYECVSRYIDRLMGVVRSMMVVMGVYYVLFIHASPDL